MTDDRIRLRQLAAEAELLAAHLENLTHQYGLISAAVVAASQRVDEMGDTLQRMNRELGELRVELMKGTDSGDEELPQRR